MIDLKRLLINKIAALRVVSNGFPSLGNLGERALNAKNNTLTFLLELLKTLVGWESFRIELVNLLAYHVLPLEQTIKIFLKKLIREHFICNTDNIIPLWLISDGFNVQISAIDFFSQLKVDPTSEVGNLLYGGSNDMNTFLYNVIHGGTTNWKNILNVTYLTSAIVDGEQKNDVFNIKVDVSYTGLTINKLLNDFISSVQILSLPLVINKLSDILFGTISFRLKNPFNRIKNEQEIYGYIEKIIDLPDEIIDDSYFTFNEAELKDINRNATERANGQRVLKSCGNLPSNIPFEEIEEMNDLLSTSSEIVDIKTILDNQFTIMGKNAVNNMPDSVKPKGLLEFYFQMLKGVATALVSSFLSPKTILFFTIYFKIANQTIGFTNFRDFLLKNKTFIDMLIRNVILPIMINFLMKIVIREIRRLLSKDKAAKREEQVRYYNLALLSLLGVPPSATILLRQLNG
jgi:hypothetical protein